MKKNCEKIAKKDIILKVSEELEITKKSSKDVLDKIIEIILSSLKEGKEVSITGLGTFKIVHRKAIIGRNPRTGLKMNIPERDVIRFKNGKELKKI